MDERSLGQQQDKLRTSPAHYTSSPLFGGKPEGLHLPDSCNWDGGDGSEVFKKWSFAWMPSALPHTWSVQHVLEAWCLERAAGRPGPPQCCPGPQPPCRMLDQGLLWETWTETRGTRREDRGSDMEGRQGAVGSPHYSTTDPKFYQPHPIKS